MLADIAPDPTEQFGPWVAVGLLVAALVALLVVVTVVVRRRRRAR